MTTFEIIDFRTKQALEHHLESARLIFEKNNIRIHQIPTKTAGKWNHIDGYAIRYELINQKTKTVGVLTTFYPYSENENSYGYMEEIFEK